MSFNFFQNMVPNAVGGWEACFVQSYIPSDLYVVKPKMVSIEEQLYNFNYRKPLISGNKYSGTFILV